jgi:hypothetical protein
MNFLGIQSIEDMGQNDELFDFTFNWANGETKMPSLGTVQELGPDWGYPYNNIDGLSMFDNAQQYELENDDSPDELQESNKVLRNNEWYDVGSGVGLLEELF